MRNKISVNLVHTRQYEGLNFPALVYFYYSHIQTFHFTRGIAALLVDTMGVEMFQHFLPEKKIVVLEEEI